MKNISIEIFAKISLMIFLYVFVTYVFLAVTTKPMEGDSLVYHIPIAKSIINGQFLHPRFYLGFYPSTAETILALCMLLHIPLNLFNVVGWYLLFFATKRLGKIFGLEKNTAIICAVSICLLPVIVRWLLAQVIDIWLAAFFVFVLTLLEKPEKKISYFLKLGLLVGLLIGAKYSGPLFAFVLALFYFKKIIQYISFSRLLAFITAVLIFGFFWYIRNFMLVHNPLYPQPFLGLPGMPNWNIFQVEVWQATLGYPFKMIDAFISEFTIWSAILGAAPFFLVYIFMSKEIKKPRTLDKIKMLLAIGIINYCIYLFLPTSVRYNIIVSSFRYSYPAVIPLMIGVFLIAQRYKKEEFLSIIALASMIMIPSLGYHPKVLVIYIPLVLIVFYSNYLCKFFNHQE